MADVVVHSELLRLKGTGTGSANLPPISLHARDATNESVREGLLAAVNLAAWVVSFTALGATCDVVKEVM